MEWTANNILVLATVAIGYAITWRLLPRESRGPADWLIGVGLIVLVGCWFVWIRPTGHGMLDFLFALFGLSAIAGAGCMIAQKNPVYAALWFAVVVLSSCGLFLLQAAPFLAAATVIIYAGAIIVTFLFVIMLAQQSGKAAYDRNSRTPAFSTLAGFILLAALLSAIQESFPASAAPADHGGHGHAAVVGDPAPLAGVENGVNPVAAVALMSSEPAAASKDAHADHDHAAGEGHDHAPTTVPLDAKGEHATAAVGSVKALGENLFGKYLWGVEIVGTLLTIAVIGAICIAPKREEMAPEGSA